MLYRYHPNLVGCRRNFIRVGTAVGIRGVRDHRAWDLRHFLAAATAAVGNFGASFGMSKGSHEFVEDCQLEDGGILISDLLVLDAEDVLVEEAARIQAANANGHGDADPLGDGDALHADDRIGGAP